MAMSGVELEAQCKTVYDEVQSKKKHRYVTFLIADGKIKVDKVIWREKFSCNFLTLLTCHIYRSVIGNQTMMHSWPICVSRTAMRMTAVTPFTIMSMLCTLKEQKHPTGMSKNHWNSRKQFFKILDFSTGLDSFWSAGVPIPPASKRRWSTRPPSTASKRPSLASKRWSKPVAMMKSSKAVLRLPSKLVFVPKSFPKITNQMCEDHTNPSTPPPIA